MASALHIIVATCGSRSSSRNVSLVLFTGEGLFLFFSFLFFFMGERCMLMRRESVRGSLVCGLKTWGWVALFVCFFLLGAPDLLLCGGSMALEKEAQM
jgi:hypothetical protein